MRARVIGIGQAAAGDDGVGAAVVRALRARGVPRGVELRDEPDAAALVDLCEPRVPTIVVDALLGDPAGRVVTLAPTEIAARSPLRVSSHGLGVAEAIELARVLHDDLDPERIRIVAITIARPDGYRDALSPEVAAAVPRAAERVLELLEVDRA